MLLDIFFPWRQIICISNSIQTELISFSCTTVPHKSQFKSGCKYASRFYFPQCRNIKNIVHMHVQLPLERKPLSVECLSYFQKKVRIDPPSRVKRIGGHFPSFQNTQHTLLQRGGGYIHIRQLFNAYSQRARAWVTPETE